MGNIVHFENWSTNTRIYLTLLRALEKVQKYSSEFCLGVLGHGTLAPMIAWCVCQPLDGGTCWDEGGYCVSDVKRIGFLS